MVPICERSHGLCNVTTHSYCCMTINIVLLCAEKHPCTHTCIALLKIYWASYEVSIWLCTYVVVRTFTGAMHSYGTHESAVVPVKFFVFRVVHTNSASQVVFTQWKSSYTCVESTHWQKSMSFYFNGTSLIACTVHTTSDARPRAVCTIVVMSRHNQYADNDRTIVGLCVAGAWLNYGHFAYWTLRLQVLNLIHHAIFENHMSAVL